jgi:hypothetical protein
MSTGDWSKLVAVSNHYLVAAEFLFLARLVMRLTASPSRHYRAIRKDELRSGWDLISSKARRFAIMTSRLI